MSPPWPVKEAIRTGRLATEDTSHSGAWRVVTRASRVVLRESPCGCDRT